MKGKYITPQLRITCLSGRPSSKKDIHAELQKTMQERNEIVRKLEALTRKADRFRIYLNYSSAA